MDQTNSKVFKDSKENNGQLKNSNSNSQVLHLALTKRQVYLFEKSFHTVEDGFDQNKIRLNRKTGVFKEIYKELDVYSDLSS